MKSIEINRTKHAVTPDINKMAVTTEDLRRTMAEMSNPSGIRPIEYKVVVRPEEVETKTAGGIILPDEAKESQQFAQMRGHIVAMSPFAFTYEEWPEGHEPPNVGDAVIVAKYAGAAWQGKDGKDYRVVNDKDIVAVLE